MSYNGKSYESETEIEAANSASLFGIIIITLFFVLILGSYIVDYLSHQALQKGDIKTYETEQNIVQYLVVGTVLVGIVSIVTFFMRKNTALVLPIPL